MFRVVILFTLTLLHVNSAVGIEVVSFHSREDGDQKLYTEFKNTTSEVEERISVSFEWIGNNETFTQVVFETNDWEMAELTQPTGPMYKRRFSATIFNVATELTVRMIVYGFTNQYLVGTNDSLLKSESFVNQNDLIQTKLNNKKG